MTLRRSTILVPICVITALGAASGCGVSEHMDHMDKNTAQMVTQLESYHSEVAALNSEIKSLNSKLTALEHIKGISESLAALQHMSQDVFASVTQKLRVTEPPGKTDDIDDVEKTKDQIK